MREIFHSMFVLVAVLFFGNAEFCSGRNTSFNCIEREREALLKLKLCFHDPLHMLSSWKGNDCCEWRGVGCDKNGHHVVSIQLKGSIFDQPQLYLIDNVEEVVSSLLMLKYLEHLDLSGNYFNKSLIPHSFGLMKQLRYLNLSHAHFRGRIPSELGNLTRLRVLDLTDYCGGALKVDDDIQWISRLSFLQQLDMSGVNLMLASSNLFQVLGMPPLLSWLSLSGCNLKNSHLPSGSHPLNFTFLGNIQHFDISWNSFHGPIPIFLQNMTSLTFLDMSGVNLSLTSSNLFQVLGMLPSVSWLSLSSCSLKNSHLPSSNHPLNFTFLGKIQHFDLSRNSFQGPIPIFLQNMTLLTFLDLSRNHFSGNITEVLLLSILRNMCGLKSLFLTSNELEGEMVGGLESSSECSRYELETMDLGENNISGLMPDWLGELKRLRYLNLSSNAFVGPIPSSLGTISSLRELDLSMNALNGTILVCIGKSLAIQKLNLFENQLSGSIPDNIGQLSKLKHINLSYNQLNGSIPDSIGKLSNLEYLSFSSNKLNGVIPNSISKLSNLQVLDVAYNSLEGVISEAHFTNLFKLIELSIGFNNLNCEMKSDWRPLFHLQYIGMQSCKFGTGFPEWLQLQNTSYMVYLSNASILGPLPENISHMMPQLRHLLLADNLINGSIPKSLCNSKTLELLDLSNNMLSRSIPNCWRNDQAFYLMDLSSNNLSGLFPNTIRKLNFLHVLQLNNNSLYGELHMALKNFNSLVVLDLGENKFSRNITWIREHKIHSLKVLRLRNNLFTGNIPLEVCLLSQLQILDLADNNLTGAILPCFGNFSNMVNATQLIPHMDGECWNWAHLMEVVKGRYLEYTKKPLGLQSSIDLSSNNLVGSIPDELVFLQGLHNLNLSWNHLEGNIPKNIGQMENLESIDFSQNDLSGPIPNSISSLTKLSHLNLSYNNLSGSIPKGNQLQTLEDPTIYANNPQLCGAPLLKKCSDDVLPPTIIGSKDNDEGVFEEMWFYIVVMLGFATGFWGVLGTLIVMQSWRCAYFQWVDDVRDWILMVIKLKVAQFKMFNGNPDEFESGTIEDI
ncbi:hypothetical protein SLE2022_402140 [Rubroshorea leprosula]